ncbi:DUF4350 domain-containing protein [Salinibacterium sp. UTAS2018]|uniref:DUF4350 domain-containing protein n=1 Tax=Salinibacterium sp. UTAS2018 TaxID=2508880 RepID=UPI00100941F7|nr:DUF4350 domain-containing protein [Salinibacterium sp. UTAS2018]QAV69955.1 DUF4350 domain-containing protein [Salinibacterium sp. UTAS2018]
MSESGTDSTVLTPRLRTTTRRSLFWIAAAILLVVVAVITLNLAGNAVEGPPLDPTSPYEAGTQAVAEVLRDQGVDVVVTTTLDDARAAADLAGESTLIFSNYEGYLTEEQVKDAAGLTSTVIVAEPVLNELLAIAPEVAQAGTSSETVAAGCTASTVAHAPQITAGPSGYRVIEPSPDITSCYGNDDDGYGLIILDRGDTELKILGATDALTNGGITAADNAAFALRLLGENDTLIWYTPSFLDIADGGGTATLDELAPGWVLPGTWLFLLTLLAGALWRGRRFGPLVIEKLPVTVRSSETMQGRARLYAKSTARLHTLDSLRIGTIRRLAMLCGMPSTASVDDVINRVSPLVGQPLAQLQHLLLDADPSTDNELISLSDELLALEDRVRTIIRPA